MHRTLLWKEWRQLALLRWLGLGLGLFLVLAFLLGGALSRGMSAAEMLAEPIAYLFGYGLWPLLAMLMAIQAFGGDRAAGTESLLLERPVPRGLTWTTRAVASLASVLYVVGANVACWEVSGAGLVRGGMGDPLLRALASGALAVPAAWLGAVAASALVAQPLAALLLAVLAAALPVGGAALLARLFPLASWAGISAGVAPAAFLLAGYAAVSAVALCLGEPAGRRRLLRAGSGLGILLVASAVLFLAAAPVAVRLGTRHSFLYGRVVPSPSPGATVVTSIRSWAPAGVQAGGAWLVDLERPRMRGLLTPAVWAVAWKPDGSRLAVATRSGPLGSLADRVRVEVFDREGSPAAKPVALPPQTGVAALEWAGDRLVAAAGEGPALRLWVLDPRSGDARVVEGVILSELVRSRRRLPAWELVGPRADGAFYVAIGDRIEFSDTGPHRSVLSGGVYRLDPAAARLAAEPVLGDAWPAGWASWSLSLSGRFWVRKSAEVGDRRVVLDLASGREIPMGRETSSHGIPRFAWLAGDRLAWVEGEEGHYQVAVARPGEAPRALAELRDPHPPSLLPSPDGRKILVLAVAPFVVGAQGGAPLGVPVSWPRWADPETLASEGWMSVSFGRPGEEGENRPLLVGSWPPKARILSLLRPAGP